MTFSELATRSKVAAAAGFTSSVITIWQFIKPLLGSGHASTAAFCCALLLAWLCAAYFLLATINSSIVEGHRLPAYSRLKRTIAVVLAIAVTVVSGVPLLGFRWVFHPSPCAIGASPGAGIFGITVVKGERAAVPRPLASERDYPGRIALSSTAVYWAENGAVISMRVGSDVQTVLAPGQPWPGGIAVDATSVYWTTSEGGGSVMKVPLRGGEPPTVLASGQSGVTEIAVDATFVYWAATRPTTALGTVVKVPIGGGTQFTLASKQREPFGLAVDSTRAYWTNQAAGTVMSVSLDGGTPITLAKAQSKPLRLAVDSSSVYWTNSTNGTVMSVPIGGGEPITLAFGQNSPYGIAVDSCCVYWTNHGGAVVSATLQGGTPVTLASDQKEPEGIAVDPTGVYWTTSGYTEGTIMKLARD